MTLSPDESASNRYVIVLEAHRATMRRRASALAWTVCHALSMDFVGQPSIGEWVVRRRSDGGEVVRMEAEAGEEAAMLRDELDRQMGTLSAVEFADRWSVPAERR